MLCNDPKGSLSPHRLHGFTFFNSAKILCRDFYELKKTLKEKQSLSALYQRPWSKLKLFNAIKDSLLYKEIQPELKSSLQQ